MVYWCLTDLPGDNFLQIGLGDQLQLACLISDGEHPDSLKQITGGVIPCGFFPTYFIFSC